MNAGRIRELVSVANLGLSLLRRHHPREVQEAERLLEASIPRDEPDRAVRPLEEGSNVSHPRVLSPGDRVILNAPCDLLLRSVRLNQEHLNRGV
jgi:hypothetical protein